MTDRMLFGLFIVGLGIMLYSAFGDTLVHANTGIPYGIFLLLVGVCVFFGDIVARNRHEEEERREEKNRQRQERRRSFKR